jgi:hypothetical protein
VVALTVVGSLLSHFNTAVDSRIRLRYEKRVPADFGWVFDERMYDYGNWNCEVV